MRGRAICRRVAGRWDGGRGESLRAVTGAGALALGLGLTLALAAAEPGEPGTKAQGPAVRSGKPGAAGPPPAALDGDPPAPAAPAAPPAIRFTDVTAAAGIRFTHENGAAGAKYLPETMGAGAAFFDADGDGWLDLLLVNGRSWKPGGEETTPALYRNRGDGTFADATRGSGLDIEMYGLGVAVADYDADGRPDVYITALEGDRLFRNLGGGKFRDVTAAAGIANASFGTSAAWLDYDEDGRADLFVANYVEWSAAGDHRCSLDGETKSYCTPEVYPGVPSKLYRNLGGGRFADVSARAGIADPSSKALGIAVLDFDGDGRPDLFVANDTRPNQLYRNRGDGTFADVALEAGVAYSDDGVARGAMGVDAGDLDRSGRPDVVVGNFANETVGLYHNLGGGRFADRAATSPVGRASLRALTFGVLLFDYDLDGWLDLLLANGHIDEGIERVQPAIRFRQPPQLFRNLGGGRLEEAGAALGPDFHRPLVARGAAYGDYDRDGDLDLVLTENGGPAHLFRNDGGNRNRWLRVKTVGTRSNRDGLGAVVRVESASGRQWATVKTGSSYCSQSETTLTFGLGRDPVVEALEIEWPSGERQRFTDLAPDRELTVVEGRGIAGGASSAGSRR